MWLGGSPQIQRLRRRSEEMKSKNDRCTEQDYRSLFETSAEELRWLCHTLTGDDSLSGKVMDTALEQSPKSVNQVFREWMVSWARRLIIRFCIGEVRPARDVHQHTYWTPGRFTSLA